MNKNYSQLVLGGAALSGAGGGYGFGEIDEASIQKLLEGAIDLGIATFDTAPIYGFGQSEKMLGKYLRAKRDKIQIITKGGVSWHSNKRVNMTNDPKVIESMLHDSLRCLNSDYIDTYLIHYPDPKVDIRKSLEVVEKARSQGKVLNIGLSNTNTQEINLALEVTPINLIQNQCNLFQNDFIDLTDFPSAYTMGWGTLDKGILTGRVNNSRKFDESDFRSWAPWWKKSSWKERVKHVENFKRKHPKVDMTTFALNFSKNQVDSLICGAKSFESLNELKEKLDSPLENLEELIKEFSREA